MAYAVMPYREPEDPVGTVCELFAGVGGFRIGLSRSGWKTTFSNQWEPSTKAQHASDCYVHNFGDEGHSNINFTELIDRHLDGSNSLIPKTDLIVGGFPCQDYSVAKTLTSAKGLEGKKGVLWWDILRLVEANRPRFVFLENVDRLLKSPSSQRGRDFAVMLKTLGALGYVVEWRVVNAAEYGYPQRRIRVYIVATKSRRSVPHRGVDARNVICRSGVLARALPVERFGGSLEEIDLTAPPVEISSEFGCGGERTPFHNSGVYFAGRAFTTRVTAKVPTRKVALGDVLEPDASVANEFWIPAARLPEWQYLKGAKTIRRTHVASGTTYEYAEGKMAFPDQLTNPSRTILTGEGGTSPSRFKHIIERDTGCRRLTPVELERLNGFPDDWTKFAGESGEMKDTRRAFFMGNALIVGLIERVGAVLADDQRRLKRR